MRAALVALLLCACGDDRGADKQDGGLIFEAGVDVSVAGELFGEPCVQPAPPEIGICHEGEGACSDEAAGSVCRPFCHIGGQPQCMARKGVEVVTDRGACVCLPP